MWFFCGRVDDPLIFSPIGESAPSPIVLALAWRLCVSTVALSPAVILSDADKLEALRLLDQFRQWRSLDEKRYCLVCGKIITGLQIEVAGGTGGNGSLRLSCPTERCNSIPMDWVLPTDEILAKVETMAAEERKAAASTSGHGSGGPERPKRGHNGIASRWPSFAFQFKGTS